MPRILRRLPCLLVLLFCVVPATWPGELPEEKPLWPDADFKNPVRYDAPDQVRTNQASKGSPSGSNRVSGEPDFAGLFYPWLRDDFGQRSGSLTTRAATRRRRS